MSVPQRMSRSVSLTTPDGTVKVRLSLGADGIVRIHVDDPAGISEIEPS